MDSPEREEQECAVISDLAVARDGDEADEVNVSWATTEPSTWGLGVNAYSTSLVVILEDEKDAKKRLHTKKLSLGSKDAKFDGVETGQEVLVQLAVVVDHADGDYIISDILEADVKQSLSKPSFMADVWRVATAGVTDDPDSTDTDETVKEKVEKTAGTLYYVGYNENFGNYKENTGSFTTRPTTARLRIGLMHSANETKDDRDEVDFEAYFVRITDESGDTLGNVDVATVESNYGANMRMVFGTQGTEDGNTTDTDTKFSNVRINDSGTIRASVQGGGPTPDCQPARLRPRKPCPIQSRQAYRVASVRRGGVSVNRPQGCSWPGPWNTTSVPGRGL